MELFFSITEKLAFIIFSLLYSVGLVLVYNRLPPVWFMESKDQVQEKSSLLKKFPDAVLFVAVFTVLAFVSYVAFGYSLWLAFFIFYLTFAVMLSASDIKTGIIPNQFTFGIAISSLLRMTLDVFFLMEGGGPWYLNILTSLLAGLVGGLILYIINFVGKLALGKESLGMGDVKLMAACGLVAGLEGVFKVLALAFVLAFIPAVLALFRKRKDGRDTLPFAPFICAALMIYLLFPDLMYHIF